MVRVPKLLTLLVGALLFAGCGSSEPQMQEIVIRPIGDTMAYETTEFTVKEGATVKIVMDNIATLDAMQHNVVILAPGADAQAVGMAAVQAGEASDYIPDDANVLYYTPLAKPGEQTVVEFTAPAPGEYTFICTFPGHFALMKGVMTVTA